MLTDEERREIDIEVQHSGGDKRAAGIEAMRIVQHRQGWVSDESLQELSDYLGLSMAELDSVATNYNLIFRQPVGRHVILVCDSISCWIMGAENVRQHMENRLGVRLGQTTSDGRFTLLPMVCLGACDHAPAMVIDDDLHGDLTAEKIDQILQQYA